ncbi:hypothetical protein AcW1_008462 [Taiwanofungus camphoratus]|nr:hypothetical protein AcW1_008462 [Antrodia cinnamomea]KAI0956317.1 hypothetical protein AcV7_006750 [Antrodia cinnamomea]
MSRGYIVQPQEYIFATPGHSARLHGHYSLHLMLGPAIRTACKLPMRGSDQKAKSTFCAYLTYTLPKETRAWACSVVRRDVLSSLMPTSEKDGKMGGENVCELQTALDSLEPASTYLRPSSGLDTHEFRARTAH